MITGSRAPAKSWSPAPSPSTAPGPGRPSYAVGLGGLGAQVQGLVALGPRWRRRQPSSSSQPQAASAHSGAGARMGGDPATAEGAMPAAQKGAEHSFRAGLEGARNETFPEGWKNALDGLFVARRPP